MPRASARTDGWRWWAASVVLLVLGAVCLGAGVRAQLSAAAVGGPAAPARIVAPPLGPAYGPPTRPAAARTRPVRRALPVRLLIPAIHLSAPVGRVGLNADGTVQVPINPGRPGWFRLGAAPGEVGSAVILGHVDSYQGPAVFYLLSAMKPGERVLVRLDDGAVAHFVVSGVEVYEGDAFPNAKVYGSHGFSALQLVTCGGGFDAATQHYLGNVVIYTRLVSITRPRTGSGRAS